MAYLKIEKIDTYDWFQKKLNYNKREEKRDYRDDLLTHINCLDGMEFQQFKLVHDCNTRKKYLAREFIQSFEIGKISPELAHQIAIEFAEEFLNKYQVVIATHIDKEHIHSHILFNNVSIIDLTCFYDSKNMLIEARKISDKICEKYNIKNIENKDIFSGDKSPEEKLESVKKKKTFIIRDELKSIIDNTIKDNIGSSFEYFINELDKKGVKVITHSEKGTKLKHIKLLHTNSKKAIRLSSLGDIYTEDNIVKMLNSGITTDLNNERKKLNNEKSDSNFIIKDYIKNVIYNILNENIGASFDEFIKKLEQENIKFITHSKNGNKLKHIKLYYKDYKNPIYLKSLGNEYTEDNIVKVLNNGNISILNNYSKKTTIIDLFLSEQEKKYKLEKEFNDYNRYGFTFSKFKKQSFIQLLDSKLYYILKDKTTHNHNEFPKLYINFSTPKNASHKANIEFNNEMVAGLGAANLLSNIGAEYKVAYFESGNIIRVSEQTKNHKTILKRINEHLQKEVEIYNSIKSKYLVSNAAKKVILKKKLNKQLEKISNIQYKKNDVIKAIKITKDYSKYKSREQDLYR